jgi:hypothetical protein
MANKNIKNILLEEIDSIKKGTLDDLRKSKQVIKACAQIVYSERLEMEQKVHDLKVKKFVRKLNGISE